MKVSKIITVFLCVTFVCGASIALTKTTQIADAFAAAEEDEVLKRMNLQAQIPQRENVASFPNEYSNVGQSFGGGLINAALYTCEEQVSQKETKYCEISTKALASMAMDNIEQETLELMEAPAGTTWGGMIKVYAGKTPLLITEEDKEILLRIVEAEATCEDVKGRMLVANVILNRVLCKGFPGSIKEVVFQENGGVYQFSPIKDGRYWKVKISERTIEAVERVLAGEDESCGALFFAARRLADPNAMSWFDTALQPLFRYGVHEFFTNK